MTAPTITTIDVTTTVTTTVVVPVATEPSQETPDEKEQRIMTYTLLARQLEYYFSTQNLSKDTYLSTLLDLNDSYVPVSIIANFGKIQALAPYEMALEAVLVAATDYSDLLEIVELDEEGKKITNNQEEKKDEQIHSTILAVGSVTGKAIPTPQIQKTEKPNRPKKISSANTTVVSPTNQAEQSTSNNVQNTIIIREVAEGVDEKTLRELFGFEGCPSVKSTIEDLHNCWFVTLDTSSKDDMFNVMMKLRTLKFPSGDSVKARVKSSTSTSRALTPNAVVYNPNISAMYAPQLGNNGGGSSSRKKRSNNKGRNNNNGSGANTRSRNGQQNGSNASKRRNSKDMTQQKQTAPNDGLKSRPKKAAAKPPSMGESNFPSLGNSKPFQVEKVPMDDEMLRNGEKKRHSVGGFSDSSSTATSSTASTPTEAFPSGVVGGGYAAALLRQAPPAPPKKAVAEKPKQKPVVKESATKGNEEKGDDKKIFESNNDLPAVTVRPPVWGQGRSFADIVSA